MTTDMEYAMVVGCSFCKQPAGAACILTTLGTEMVFPHPTRFAEAQQLRNADIEAALDATI